MKFRWTILPALCLAVLAGTASYMRATMISTVLYHDFGFGVDAQSGPKTQDTMFDADISKKVDVMTKRLATRHSGTSQHPLMSLYMYSPVKILQTSGFDQIRAIHLTIALTSAVWVVLLFYLLIAWGCRVGDAALFSVLGQASAASVFWFSVPETFTFASVTIILALILTIWPQQMSPVVRFTAAVASSLSMAVTNSMVGLIASIRRFGLKDLGIVGTGAWFIVTMLWALEKKLFPAAAFFFPADGAWASKFVVTPTLPRIWQVIQAQLSHTMVMPEIGVMQGIELHQVYLNSAEQVLTVQRSWAGSGGVFGAIATIAWLVLAVLGGWAAWKARSGLGGTVALILAAQCVFHITFGPETFLYSMHILPLLVVLAAGVTFTSQRRLGLVLAVAVIVFGGMNNWTQFRVAAGTVSEFADYARTFPGTQP